MFEDLHAGNIEPSDKRYLVTNAHGHQTLRYGDEVALVVAPGHVILLLRTSDMTLHPLEDSYEQYVHLAETLVVEPKVMRAQNQDPKAAI